jgi:hypothetical protein
MHAHIEFTGASIHRDDARIKVYANDRDGADIKVYYHRDDAELRLYTNDKD